MGYGAILGEMTHKRDVSARKTPLTAFEGDNYKAFIHASLLRHKVLLLYRQESLIFRDGLGLLVENLLERLQLVRDLGNQVLNLNCLGMYVCIPLYLGLPSI